MEFYFTAFSFWRKIMSKILKFPFIMFSISYLILSLYLHQNVQTIWHWFIALLWQDDCVFAFLSFNIVCKNVSWIICWLGYKMQRIYERTIQIFSLQIKNACIMQTKPGAISDMVVLIKIYCLNQCTRKNMIVCRSIAISICYIKLLKPHKMILISKLFSVYRWNR